MTHPEQEPASGVEWHRDGSLIYTLVEDGRRKGKPIMVNGMEVRVTPAKHHDQEDAVRLAERIHAALSASPTPPADPAASSEGLEVVAWAEAAVMDDLAARLERALRTAEDWAGTLPAKEAVKLRPKDWHAVTDLARQAATALRADRAAIEPDAKKMEQAAKAMFAHHGGVNFDDQHQCVDVTMYPEGYRTLALIALRAIAPSSPPECQTGGQTDV